MVFSWRNLWVVHCWFFVGRRFFSNEKMRFKSLMELFHWLFTLDFPTFVFRKIVKSDSPTHMTKIQHPHHYLEFASVLKRSLSKYQEKYIKNYVLQCHAIYNLSKVVKQHTFGTHRKEPLPTGYNGIPFIVGQGDCLGCTISECVAIVLESWKVTCWSWKWFLNPTKKTHHLTWKP